MKPCLSVILNSYTFFTSHHQECGLVRHLTFLISKPGLPLEQSIVGTYTKAVLPSRQTAHTSPFTGQDLVLLFSEVSQWAGDILKFRHKPTIIASQSQELLQVEAGITWTPNKPNERVTNLCKSRLSPVLNKSDQPIK